MKNKGNERDSAQRIKLFALQIIKMYSGMRGGAIAQVLGRRILRTAKDYLMSLISLPRTLYWII
jgi:hypothetical protein